MAPAFTKTGVKRMLESAMIHMACNDKTLSMLAEALIGNSSYKDLSVSDVSAGLFLNNFVWHHKRESGVRLRDVKNLRIHEYLKYVDKHPERVNSENDIQLFKDKEVLDAMHHYATYSNAIYGVSFESIRRIRSGTLLSILQKIKERLRQNRLLPKEVVQIKTLIEACDGEMIYSSLDDNLDILPWFLAYDYPTNAIVLCIRGTKSLTNVLTDFLSQPVSLADLGRKYGFNGANGYTHQGMLLVTENILHSLEEHNILEALFHNKPHASDIEISPAVLSHITPSTKFILTGHSLGGGIASLLSICLQQEFPNECFAFDPPGQTISLNLRDITLSNTYTTVMGDDMFPRLSAQTYEGLQDDVVIGLCYCKLNKLQLLINLLPFSHPTLKDLFYEDESQIPEEKRRYLKKWMEARKEAGGPQPCVLPGKIVHFQNVTVEKKGSDGKMHKKRTVRAVKAEIDDFYDFRAGKRVFLHHLIFNFTDWIQSAIDNLEDE